MLKYRQFNAGKTPAGGKIKRIPSEWYTACPFTRSKRTQSLVNSTIQPILKSVKNAQKKQSVYKNTLFNVFY